MNTKTIAKLAITIGLVFLRWLEEELTRPSERRELQPYAPNDPDVY